MGLSSFLAFVAVSVVLALTPGPDTLLSLRYGLLGRGAGLGAATGTSLAIFVWAALAGTGAAAVLHASEALYEGLRLVGGAYLIYLGARTVVHARRRVLSSSTGHALGDQAGPPRPSPDGLRATGSLVVAAPSWRVGFLSGIATCLTNPKTGLFFIALFPQFAPRDANPVFVIGVLGGTVAVVVYGYLTSVALLADSAGHRRDRPGVTGWIEAISGSALVAFGFLTIVLAIPDLIQSS